MTLLKDRWLSLTILIVGVVLADYLFWSQYFGINCLLFSIFWVTTLWLLFPEARSSRAFFFTALGTLFTAVMVTWNNSLASKYAFVISSVCVVGFAHVPELKFLLHAFFHYFFNAVSVPTGIFHLLDFRQSSKKPSKKSWLSWVGLTVLPMLVVFVFYFLYYLSNDDFAQLSNRFWDRFFSLFNFDFSIDRVFFVFLLIFIIGAALTKGSNYFAENAAKAADYLLRKDPSRSAINPNTGKREAIVDTPFFETRISMLGLKTAYQQSVLLLVMLNVLLFLVNTVDIIYVWFGFNEEVAANLKSYVHEGTTFLIISILLAMCVLFYVFQKNLNFYPKRKVLIVLALAWLIQNAVLALSVGIRNWHYIDYHGFAYKRIGVFLFLTLVLFGLATLWLKLRDRRTLGWFWRINAWALYVLLLINAIIPWDTYITQYNLFTNHKGATDIQWLVSTVSDKNLRLLENNMGILCTKKAYPEITPSKIQEAVLEKRNDFELKDKEDGWPSWSWMGREQIRKY